MRYISNQFLWQAKTVMAFSYFSLSSYLSLLIAVLIFIQIGSLSRKLARGDREAWEIIRKLMRRKELKKILNSNSVAFKILANQGDFDLHPILPFEMAQSKVQVRRIGINKTSTNQTHTGLWHEIQKINESYMEIIFEDQWDHIWRSHIRVTHLVTMLEPFLIHMQNHTLMWNPL